LEEKERLRLLEKMFEWWKAAGNIKLNLLGRGWAKAMFPVIDEVLTMHPMPMVVGKEIEAAASKVGVLAAMTLTNENEYVVYSHDSSLNSRGLFEATVPEEKSLIITAVVLNDRLAKSNLISVRAQVESIYGRNKAEYIFFYKVLPREKMEQKLLELKSLANQAERAAH